MISVLMPVHNEEKFITFAIKSVLSQSYTDVELVIVDDKSEDRTLQIIEQNATHDSRVRVFLNPHKGKVKAVNYAFSRSHGQWIMILAGDDFLEENILSRWAIETESYNPFSDKIAFVSKIREFSEEDEFKRFNGIIIPRKNIAVIAGSNYLMSRAIAEDMFPLPENYPNEDGWTRLCFRYLEYKTIFIPSIAVNYRRHSNNSINPNADFSVFNEYYHQRKMVVREFRQRKKDILPEDKIKKLIDEENIEYFRYHGMMLRILFSNGCCIYEKIRNLILSRPTLYKIKIKFEHLLIGRIMK